MLDVAVQWLIGLVGIGLLLLVVRWFDRRAKPRDAAEPGLARARGELSAPMAESVARASSPSFGAKVSSIPPPRRTEGVGAAASPPIPPALRPGPPSDRLSAPNDGPSPLVALPPAPKALTPTLPAASAPDWPADIGGAGGPPRPAARPGSPAGPAPGARPSGGGIGPRFGGGGGGMFSRRSNEPVNPVSAPTPARPAAPVTAPATAAAAAVAAAVTTAAAAPRPKLPAAARATSLPVPRIGEAIARYRDALAQEAAARHLILGKESPLNHASGQRMPEPFRKLVSTRPPDFDLVQASVFAARIAPIDTQFLIQLWLHRPEDAAEAAEGAKEADAEATRNKTRSLLAEIARGARVDVEIFCKDLEIDLDDRVQSIVWRGAPEACDFVVRAPARMAGKSIFPKFTIEADGIPAGSVQCKLVCAAAPVAQSRAPTRSPGHMPMSTLMDLPEAPDLAPVEANARNYRRAFISYSNKDTEQATLIASGLSAGNPGLEFFIDVDAMRAGENWRERICDYIRGCDLFVLVWSGNAKASSEVENEWQYALLQQAMGEAGGPDFYPVTIEGPPIPQPPDELAHLNFRDRLQYIRAAAATATPAKPQAPPPG